MGNRGCTGGTEDTVARRPGGAALQDPGAGAPGGLGPAAGAFRRAWAHARSRFAGRRGSRSIVLLACRARGPPQDPAVCGASPLRAHPETLLPHGRHGAVIVAV